MSHSPLYKQPSSNIAVRSSYSLHTPLTTRYIAVCPCGYYSTDVVWCMFTWCRPWPRYICFIVEFLLAAVFWTVWKGSLTCQIKTGRVLSFLLLGFIYLVSLSLLLLLILPVRFLVSQFSLYLRQRLDLKASKQCDIERHLCSRSRFIMQKLSHYQGKHDTDSTLSLLSFKLDRRLLYSLS